ncbi:MAG: hypothetical protein JW996_06965 [Candidatus Cloacimonetes bacterium]|nr:hypothetical protein [Candidatus Cloacimonadota bacterium]
MEDKYLKDFVIALIVIVVLAFGIKDYYIMQKVKTVPKESKYQVLTLSDELLTRIQNIENSIQDRKEFTFTVQKDPLEQNLIVRTKKDLEKQWREEVESMVRLQSTVIMENGDKIASIAYQGENNYYRVGDTFVFGIITDIKEGEILYNYKGRYGVLKVTKLPEKPREITEKSTSKTREYNW